MTFRTGFFFVYTKSGDLCAQKEHEANKDLWTLVLHEHISDLFKRNRTRLVGRIWRRIVNLLRASVLLVDK